MAELALNISSGAASLSASQQRGQGVRLCGGTDQDCAEVLHGDMPGALIASLKRRPVEKLSIAGRGVGSRTELGSDGDGG